MKAGTNSSSPLANSSHLDYSEEVVNVKDCRMAEILNAGSEPPPKVLHSSIGLDNDPKIKPPDS